MKISLNWLNDYVAVTIPPAELVERMTMIGLVAETIEEKDGDIILDVETYANRPDTLGHLGVAREIAAMLEAPIIEKKWPVEELDQKTGEVMDIQIWDDGFCPRYCGIVVKGVRVGPSPDWLRKRIEGMGLRPINNVVDASNYVLFATAHPIHVFDLNKLAGRKIIVRKASKGESLKTLEGKLLELSPDMLVIADEEKPVALAGVMGGEETGVVESTTDVFIESACFDPVSVRMTGKKTGLSTDASYRFERGADISFPPRAALMAASILSQFGGKATRGVLDIYPKPRKTRSVILRLSRVNGLLGTKVPGDFISRVLKQLGFTAAEDKKGIWRVNVPTFRVDIEGETDLVEEVARFYGYDKIPSEITPLRAMEPPAAKTRDRLWKLRDNLFHQGFDEVINFSFADPDKENVLNSGRKPIPIRNPISAKASLLRTSLMAGLLENAAWNRNREIDDIHIFEIGNIYFWTEEGRAERLVLGLLSTGPLGKPSWQARPEMADFYHIKGAVEVLMSGLRYEPFVFEEVSHPYFEDGEVLSVVFKGERVGVFGHLRKTVLDAYSLEGPVYAAELDLTGLFEKQPRPFAFAPVPKFPGAYRDISFLVDRSVRYQDVRRAIERLSIPCLEGFELQDRYAGPSVPGNRISLSVRLRFRHPKRTLTTEEVDKFQQEVIGHLKSGLNIQLREGGLN
ncbi:MAG: phenylalanine--tRNA ligase subunit beta [Acidobacteriota bacterium]|nr:phenylalanine--tRNA ligase subunit beta [Acidobacteriota bacterium]